MSGGEINCTDCHGNSDPGGLAGPHGSPVRYILRAPYEATDAHEESELTYGLCYACHDREAVLQSQLFPPHALHVVDEQTSCSTCHDPHGSRLSRALIRFDDDRATYGVLASSATDRLEFVSVAPGVGECYLTCHGYDHAPEVYGGTTSEERRLEDKRSITGREERSRRPPRGSGTRPRGR
jgi:predicted CXXCH cytochrome family protein